MQIAAGSRQKSQKGQIEARTPREQRSAYDKKKKKKLFVHVGNLYNDIHVWMRGMHQIHSIGAHRGTAQINFANVGAVLEQLLQTG